MMPQPNPTDEALNALREKLREMFHFAQNDLDFGIFRILKIKRDSVNRFIDEKLTDIVDEALAGITAALYDSQLNEVKRYIEKEGGATEKGSLADFSANYQLLIDFLTYKRQDELIALLQVDPAALKSKLAFRVYNHVHNFFERYYRDGDFGYNDRSTALYKVDYPDEADYSGTDTLFHWKCRDSYYVKTATGFNSVAFEVEGKRIEYRLEGKAITSIAQNNNSDDVKHYRLDRIEREAQAREPAPTTEGSTWHVILHLADTSTPKVEIYRAMNAQIFGKTDDVDAYLHERPRKGAEQGKPLFKDLTDTYNKVQNGRLQGISALRLSLANYAAKLAEHPDFKELGKNKTARQKILEKCHKVQRFHTFDKNLNTFFVGMDSDYFIHKDLDKFLKTEQRRYIQNSILGDLDTLLNLSPENPTFAVAQAFRAVTDEVIALLVTVETFQKQLFLMKKKVITTDYLISIGKISEATKDDTTQREALFSQILENKTQLADWRQTFDVDIREQLPLLEGLYPTLPLDTRHFDDTFVDELLALFEDLDSQIDGVLLNSENFQALNLLMKKYRSSIRCVHIDPPYNTNTSGFLYKNNYQHASWLTMMQNRLSLAEQLMAPDSCILCHIDENEYEKLFLLFNNLPMLNQGTVVWDKRNPVGASKTIAIQHEYIICQSKGNVKLKVQLVNGETILKKAASLVKQYGGPTAQCCAKFKAWIHKKAEFSGMERAYSEIDDSEQVYTTVHMGAGDLRTDPKYFRPLIHPDTKKPCPVPKNGWSSTPEYINGLLEKKAISFGIDETTQPRQKWYLKDRLVGELSSVISTGERGKHQMDALGLSFPYSHPVGLYGQFIWAVTSEGTGTILDFFAGSGTTAHATINLNRQDGGSRKYILIEMGHHFHTVLKPRILKAIYAEKWKAAKPVSRESRLAHIIKYQRIESYSDTLGNIEFTETESENLLLDKHLLSYLFGSETRESPTLLNIAKIQNPFNYQLNIVNGFETETQIVDLPETFNYLLGISVQTRHCLYDEGRRYLIYRGTVGQKTVAILWRDTEGWGQQDWERDYRFIQAHKLTEGASEVYVNTDSIVPEAKSLDALFKRLMFS